MNPNAPDEVERRYKEFGVEHPAESQKKFEPETATSFTVRINAGVLVMIESDTMFARTETHDPTTTGVPDGDCADPNAVKVTDAVSIHAKAHIANGTTDITKIRQ